MFSKQEFVKELEEKSALKASVIGSGSLILMLGEREQNAETQKNNKTSVARKTSSGHTKDLQPSKSSNIPEEFSSVDVTASSAAEDNLETMFSSGQSTFSTGTHTTTKRLNTDVAKSRYSQEFVQDVLTTDNNSEIYATEHIFSLDSVTNKDSASEETASSTQGLSVKPDTILSPVLLSLQSQLSQVEQDWVKIHSNIPTVQQKLHQVYLHLWIWQTISFSLT